MNELFRRLFVMSWNVRGLGDSEKCDVVRDAIASATPSVCYLQETKLHDIPAPKARTFLPPRLPTPFTSSALQEHGVAS